MREIDQQFGTIESGCTHLVDKWSTSRKKHTFEQMVRQWVYQIAAGYEDCNDADHLRSDPALRLALNKGYQFGACQSVMSRLDGVLAFSGTNLCFKQRKFDQNFANGHSE